MPHRVDGSITLGSASPRRAALLESVGVRFEVDTVALDEHALVDPTQGDPRAAVARIARAKFDAFPASVELPSTLLTADTLVACNGAVLGKPDSDDHLYSMLRSMSGQDLDIATAVCVGARAGTPSWEVVTTLVKLRDLTDLEIERYIATGVGLDKAGGLALQAEAGDFIDSVDGCWSNLLGLPLCAVSVLLGRDHADTRSRKQRCGLDRCGQGPD